MQNLAVAGLPMHLTEFGIQNTADANVQANILSEALRLVFGMPDTTGFTMWGFWAGAVWSGAPNGVLYNQDWTIRPTGTAWNNLQNQWNTDLTLEVGPDGTINFNGFYGTYDVTIGGQTFELDLTKGQSLYSLVVAPGDYNSDGIVDMGDFVMWSKTFGSSTDLRADGNGDLIINEQDFVVWRSNFGATYGGSGSGLVGVPEPSTLTCLVVTALCGYLRRRTRTRSGATAEARAV
jgi:hypothetical protein